MASAAPLAIAVDDPAAEDVRALVEVHLAFAHDVTPACHVHALPIEALRTPEVTFFSARRDGVLLAIGALKRLDDTHVEIKSMHTTAAARRSGVGAQLLDHLLAEARARGYERVSLETGTQDAFAPARALYARAGFTTCAPFGEYIDTPESAYMTLTLSSS